MKTSTGNDLSTPLARRGVFHHARLCAILAAALPTCFFGTARADDRPATVPATAPTTLASTIPASMPSRFTFNFRDASMDQVLKRLSEAAGFIIVDAPSIDRRVNILSEKPVTPEEAVTLLNRELRISGFAAIRSGRELRIITFDKAKKSNIPVHFGADPTLIPATDELITQVVPVVAVDAVKLKTDLAPMIGPDADVSSNAASNSILITDTSANVRRIVEIINALDMHQSQSSDIRVITLKYADATSASKLLTDILAPAQPQLSPQERSMQMFLRSRNGGGANPASADESHGGKLVASADPRTNTVVLAGPADTVKLAEGILKELDADQTDQVTFFIYSLKNGQAVDLEGVLNTLFGASNGGARNNNSVNNGFGVNGANNALTRTGAAGGAGSIGSRTIGSAGSSGGSSTSGNRGGINPLGPANNNQNQNRGGAPVSGALATAAQQLLGQVYVVANPDTNALLVTTSSKYEKKVRAILEELDRPVPQVLIKCLIAEVTHDNSEDLGVEYSILNQRADGKGFKIGPTFGVSGASSGLVGSLVEGNFTAAVQALASNDKLDVLSRPYILATDNQLASIIVGQEIPLITDTRFTDTGQQINTVSYTQIGIIVNVTPHINPEGLVIMDVAPQVSQLSTTTVSIGAGVNAPAIDTRAAQTRVGIRDGQTIVIGGLMQDQKTTTIKKIPLLGDIPGLGVLFRSSSIKKSKTELLIFLTPHVAAVPDSLQRMSQDEMGGTRLTPAAVQPGTFEDHLRGLQRGSTQPSTQPLLMPMDIAAAPPGINPRLPGVGPQVNPPTPVPATVPLTTPSSVPADSSTEKPHGS